MWVAGLIVVVGAAVLGGAGSQGAGVAAATPVRPRAGGTAATAAGASGAESAALATSSIVIEQPDREGARVESADLVVAGYLRDGTGPVRVIVETSRNKPLAIQQVETRQGGPLGGRPRFEVTLSIGDRREGERLIIHVIAYDDTGTPVAVQRRRVMIGPETDIIGEDGLMGGIAFPSASPVPSP